MFRIATPQNTPRAVPLVGKLTPFNVPYKGLNYRSPFSVMGPEYAISLINAIPESFGLRSRKGYTEWATGIPAPQNPVKTLMSYYPPTLVPIPNPGLAPYIGNVDFISPRISDNPQGVLFAAKNGFIYDVTLGGLGPFAPQAGVLGVTDLWAWVNFNNIAGSFLLAANEGGGYAYFNGAAWTTPTQGAGVGQIDGVNPFLFAHVMVWKHRVWFVEKNSTKAWYLPVNQITGLATDFDFGEQFKHGGQLSVLVNWTIDGGTGLDDFLVAIGSQGDVVIYKGTDPSDPDKFELVGVWYCGPLPAGRRQVMPAAGEVFILSQFGLQALTKIMKATTIQQLVSDSVSYDIDPFVARLMQVYANYEGWQILDAIKEELILIGLPQVATTSGGEFMAYKTTTRAWTRIGGTGYHHILNIGNLIFAGTNDGRVVKAFNGPLDNVLIGGTSGTPIQCQVIPAYSTMDAPGYQKHATMIRPTFLTTFSPSLVVRVLSDYNIPGTISVPTIPPIIDYLWNDPASLWDIATWGGVIKPIKKWIGVKGSGFAITYQLDYKCGGDTLLTSIDAWTQTGGIL